MPEIDISINYFTEEPEKNLQTLLSAYKEKAGLSVHCNVIDWGNAWGETMKIVLYKRGPVLSQVGTTWMGSLEGTDALRPFKPFELNQIGQAHNFQQSSWETVISDAGDRVLGIPWSLDGYMLYYRRSLLEKAGVDESTAFSTLEAFTETLARLHAAGIEIPLALPTQKATRTSLHNMAGWVWTHGGDFLSKNGKDLLLSEASTRQGMKAYFSIHPYINPQIRNIAAYECTPLFMEGRAAIILHNSAMLYISHRDGHPSYSDIGITAMPGINFVGGTNLVIWKHIPGAMEKYALGILEHLASPDVQYAYNNLCGVLPTRIEALDRLRQESSDFGPVITALLGGRSFSKHKLWGLVEDRISPAIGKVWEALQTAENPDIEKEIANVFDPLERRLQLTISNQ